MSLQHSYVRRAAYEPGETLDFATVSIDIGPKNFIIERLSMLAPTERVMTERCVVIDLKGPNGEQDANTIGQSLRTTFNGSDYQWMWEPPVPIVPERQVDHIRAVAGAGYRPPINFAIYCMIQQMVLDRIAPMLLLSERAWTFLEEQGIDPMDDVFVPQGLSWVPRAGSQKSGLESFHEEERKTKTLEVGPSVMRKNGDKDFAVWTERLRPVTRPSQVKPMEDACDAYLQGHHYLHSVLVARKKESRKTSRSEKAQAKRDDKAARRKAREELLRKKAAEKEGKEKEKERKKAEGKGKKAGAARGKKRPREEPEKPEPKQPNEEEEPVLRGPKQDSLDADDLEVIGLLAPPDPIEVFSDEEDEEAMRERPRKRLRKLNQNEDDAEELDVASSDRSFEKPSSSPNPEDDIESAESSQEILDHR
jgi:hypothetical protein